MRVAGDEEEERFVLLRAAGDSVELSSAGMLGGRSSNASLSKVSKGVERRNGFYEQRLAERVKRRGPAAFLCF